MWGRRSDYAHRWTYREFVGEIPQGFTIDHLCRNGLCQNPTHLEAVSAAENSRRYVVNRPPVRGEKKLSLDDRRRIRELRQEGRTQTSIAQLFGVTQSVISRTLSGGRRKSSKGTV